MPPHQYRPEIFDAMRRMDKALGSPRFPKLPLLDVMVALCGFVGHYERLLGREALSTWSYVEAGFDQISDDERKNRRTMPPPIAITIELARNAIQRQIEVEPIIDPQIWLNLCANVLGQLCAIEGVDPVAYEAYIQQAYDDVGDVATA